MHHVCWWSDNYYFLLLITYWSFDRRTPFHHCDMVYHILSQWRSLSICKLLDQWCLVCTMWQTKYTTYSLAILLYKHSWSTVMGLTEHKKRFQKNFSNLCNKSASCLLRSIDGCNVGVDDVQTQCIKGFAELQQWPWFSLAWNLHIVHSFQFWYWNLPSKKIVRLTQLLEFVLNISSSVKNTMYLLVYMTHKIH